MGVIARQSLRAAIAIGAGMALGAVNTLYVLPRAFEGHEDLWGLVRVLISWGAIASQILTLGIPSAMLRFLPRYSDDERSQVFTTMLLFPAAALAVTGLVMAIGGEAAVARWGGDDADVVHGRLGYLYVIIVVFAVAAVARATVISRLKSTVVNVMEEPWLKGSYLALALAFGAGLLGFDAFLLAYVGTYVVYAGVIAAQAWANRIRLKLPLKTGEIRNFLGYSGFNLLTIGSAVIAQNLDYVMVGSYLGLAEVPKYSLAAFVGYVVALPSRAASGILSGVSADRMAKEGPEGMRTLCRQATRVKFSLALAVFVAIWAGYPAFEQLLPPAYHGLEPVFIAIGLQQVVLAAGGTVGATIGFGPHYRKGLPIQVGLLVMTVLTNHVCMQTFGWGLAGAAVATLFTAVWNFGWYTLLLWRLHRIHPFSWDLLKVAAVSSVCAVVFRTVLLPEMPHWLEAGGRGALAGGAALAGGLALGAIPELRDAIRRTIGR
jgi:O-antigen/teichoic acid export membrane protein